MSKYPILNRIEEKFAEREESYGDPKEKFLDIATMWSIILGRTITPQEVALCMIGLKICRETVNHKEDNLDDIVGYAIVHDSLKNIG